MAVAQLYTAVANDVITAARWNNEFGNIYNNGTDIAFPLTEAVSLAGFTLTLDAAGVTTFSSTASQALSFTPGAKAGTPNTTGKALNVVASTFTDSNTAGSGTATAFASVAFQQPTLAATNTLVTTTDAATVYIANAPAAGTNETLTNAWALWVDSGAVRFDGALRVDGILTITNPYTLTGAFVAGKPIGGLTYARDAGDTTNDIVVNVGEAASDDAAVGSRKLMVLASSIIGQIDTGTWVVGTNQPKLDTGSVANVPYFIWLIMRSDTGVVDILFSASATAPTMPTSYSYKRLIGWFDRDAGANLGFTTSEMEGGGLRFTWDVPLLDVSLTNAPTTSERTDVLNVPVGISVLATFNVSAQDAAAGWNVWIYDTDQTSAAPATTAAPLATFRAAVGIVMTVQATIKTDTTGAVAMRSSLATVDALYLSTMSFVMSRR